NCNVYNDGAFDAVREQKENRIRLEHGKPIRFGAEDERGVRLRPDGSAELVEVAEGGEEALLVHDEHVESPSLASALARLSHTPHGPTPIGVFRDVERPVYDRLMSEQLETARTEQGEGDLAELLHAGDTWTIS
ncbi:MAG: 2-oxoacid:ferredoxin oxidoreductase subunit beta, partial [Actinomycetota bacterium]|nr:2-oxoacid:ferredoxin oxidoreductase subunit beta [Actinomycetota bacterium]